MVSKCRSVLASVFWKSQPPALDFNKGALESEPGIREGLVNAAALLSEGVLQQVLNTRRPQAQYGREQRGI